MKFLITAGPTREAIDPVRYITNKSSGRMGYALAAAAAAQGHHVTLISGPTSLPIPDDVDFVYVTSSDEMYDSVKKFVSDTDVAILCAAVADYKPLSVPIHKIKKSADTMCLELIKTRDILGSMRDIFGFQGYLVGFAAETHDVESYARGKLERKKCDLIVANDVSQAGIGFDSLENEVKLIFPSFTDVIARTTKEEIARILIYQVTKLAEKD